ncbi:hypothetical protein MAE02_70290 [Microvirga aerophila]|uniref:Uncharacterized protein n=1 Tax=Microvirga aerophila TaxID=670291 RepID=A0A512C516_9HYPH|nr:hypothetical protein MAE02_70290 [Microvirga aerophila]
MVIEEPARVRPGRRQYAYNLFRNRLRLKLPCAVPAERPVPGFLGPEQWSFEQVLGRSEAALPGFRDRAASVGVRLNGFNLLQAPRPKGWS